jgi:hypothetical protein
MTSEFIDGSHHSSSFVYGDQRRIMKHSYRDRPFNLHGVGDTACTLVLPSYVLVEDVNFSVFSKGLL